MAATPPGISPDTTRARAIVYRRQPILPATALNLLRTLEFCRFRHKASGLTQTLAQVIISGHLFDPFAAGRALLALCSAASTLPLAITLFFVLPCADAFAGNTILRSLLASGLPSAALSFYRRIFLPAAIAPNHFTFPLLAKLFSSLHLPLDGRKAHAGITKLGFLADLFVRNALIHMYSSFNEIDSAEQLFALSRHLGRDAVTYNSMIAGYVRNGRITGARAVFDEMVVKDVVSWNTMIAGYAGSGDMGTAMELFWMIPERDAVSWNSMIDGFARLGETSIARELFDSMPARNLVSWNALLALYARIKDYGECSDLFERMILAGQPKPDKATFVSALTACAHLGQLERGKRMHSLIKEGGIELDVLLSTSLLTMYAKCGAIESAREVFDQMPERSAVSWNAMIMGYGLHGRAGEALEVFMEMELSGARPNESTFVCILSACVQSGWVIEGWWCFDRMVRCYGMKPAAEHAGCMVDLLGRSGLLEDTTELVQRLEEKPAKALWGALMSSSWTHSNWEIGKFVGKSLAEIMPEEVGPYVLLSNIWAAEGNWEEVEKIRVTMEERGLRKPAAMSLLLDDNASAAAEERLCGRSKERIVYSLMREMGSRFKISSTEFHGNEKQHFLC